MKKIIVTFITILLLVGLYSSVEKVSWTKNPYKENGQDYVTYTASAVVEAADSVFYTEPTNFKINWNLPFKVVINPTGAAIDGAALPVTMYCGTSDTFDLSIIGNGTASITGGYEYGTIEADVHATVGQVIFYAGARALVDSTDSFYWIAPCSQLAFDLDTVDGFTAGTVTIVITQPMSMDIPRDHLKLW